MVKFSPFDAADDLDDEPTVAEYISAAPAAKPRYDTLLKRRHALGVKLSASPLGQ